LRYVCLAFALTVTPAGAQVIKGPAIVLDGNSLDVQGQQIRMHGVDAPELDQTCADISGKRYYCGRRAAFELADWIGDRQVRCRLEGIVGPDNRPFAFCTVRGQHISRWLIDHGWAIAFRQFSTDYVAAEKIARDNSVGIWEGEFVSPGQWRRGKR
jgi:endonuclease YncB( thermonuclease family)